MNPCEAALEQAKKLDAAVDIAKDRLGEAAPKKKSKQAKQDPVEAAGDGSEAKDQVSLHMHALDVCTDMLQVRAACARCINSNIHQRPTCRHTCFT